MGTPEYFPKSPPSTGCTHKADICHNCLKSTIRTFVASHTAAGGINCPKDTCRALLSYHDVRKWADVDIFERFVNVMMVNINISLIFMFHRFDQAVLLHTLNNEESFIRCLNVKCNAGMFHTMISQYKSSFLLLVLTNIVKATIRGLPAMLAGKINVFKIRSSGMKV
jgi:hypothetical protein